MDKIELVLVSGRTMDQGISLEIGKTSDEYLRSVSVIELNPDDMKSLELKDGDNVELSNENGSVIVRSRASDSLDPGLAFITYGPWANQVIDSYTGGTGMPQYKNVRVTLKPAKARQVPTLEELIESLRS